MSEKEINSTKFYYPYCREHNCDGVLEIKINDNFSIDSICDKSNNHQNKNIYFKTFERYYLKEENIDKCNTCDTKLQNFNKFKCKKCSKFYCLSCFKYDIHIKDNINHLQIISNNCSKHKAHIISYCIVCKQYLCSICLKESDDKHLYHTQSDLIDLMPTLKDINELKNYIKSYDELIESLDIWVKELISKVDRLKQNILDEKDLIIKLTSNYNYYFSNYSYFKNFDYIKNYIRKYNNNYMDDLSKYYTFHKKTEILLEYFKNIYDYEQKNQNEIDSKTGYLSYCYEIKNKIFQKPQIKI